MLKGLFRGFERNPMIQQAFQNDLLSEIEKGERSLSIIEHAALIARDVYASYQYLAGIWTVMLNGFTNRYPHNR